jgi:mono/diheme cytochrome c family protein
MFMRFRNLAIFALLAVILSACNFSLAEDITPPPNYKSPTPAPTTGPLFPANPPNTVSGAAIFAEKCVPCHGSVGLGDGPQAANLPVTVPRLGVAETARGAAPSQWYTVVTQGNIQRFMPPFASLTDQERWDVVAFAYSLSITSEEASAGKSLFETRCAPCHGTDGKKIASADLTDQALMAALSQNDIAGFIQKGVPPQMPASDLNDDDAFAVAAYVRTFTFASPHVAGVVEPAATSQPSAVTLGAASTGEGTPSASLEAGTPAVVEGTPAQNAASVSQVGSFRGKVSNASTGSVPAGLTVTLRAFDHNQAGGGTFDEAFSKDGIINPDGTFSFENVELTQGRIYVAEVKYGGVPYQSEPIAVNNQETSFTFAPLEIYETTTDFSSLTVNQVHFFFEAPVNGQIPVSAVYVFTNSTKQSVLVESDGTTIPFITTPQGVVDVGYQDAGMGGKFLPADKGFVIPPGTEQYGIIAIFSLPYDKKLEYSQSFKLNVTSGSVIVPEGMKAKGDGLTEGEVRPMSSGQNFQSYQFTTTGNSVAFTISGEPKAGAAAVVGGDSTRNIIIGVGVFGAVLILAGIFLFWRDRRSVREDADKYTDVDEEEEDDENSDELMDAIIALDDQYKAGNISEEAYKKRREELKTRLKSKL